MDKCANLNIFVGSVYVFVTSDGGLTWSESQKLVATDGAAYDEFGYYIAISGNVLVVGVSKDDDSGESSGSTYSCVCCLTHLSSFSLCIE